MNDVNVLDEIIYPALADMVEAGLIDEIERAPDTSLMADGSKMTSLQAISLIVAVEKRVQEKWGRVITLADERAMSRTRSPFLTLKTLADYVGEVMAAD